mmetsp:Transcript_11037/g.15314  ORF Transcript_11037/g.15314 Transcript_11037/m.15314 type:complete len:165 (-) Transcript_11037:38-532(-)|eukprot:CAMPEP_0185730366 /NCGR_PEP_ID=MMETSP1171-20130828/9709_1 /TAXON_ID=374046 /ORGANISM="Helicotheca tamensis, Strain CCMP826" /LENGTH=164 /DNA_ID=CAMNT_0028399397 /DNA_START=1 /DNA_END=495 /DNA_ORIENTATION=+
MASMDGCEEDDFFGDQGDDLDENASNNFNGFEDIKANPQQGDLSRAMEGLAFHDTRATEETFHNMGYHEGYDEAKELRLQEGFEAGYREVFESALRVGKMLGDVSTRAVLETPALETMKNDQREEQANEAALMVKSFLDEQVNKETGDVKDLEAILQNLLRIKE